MVYIILGKGFEEIEAIAPCDILRRGGVSVSFAAVGNDRAVTGGHGITLLADVLVSEADIASAEAIMVPGGMGGVETIMIYYLFNTAISFTVTIFPLPCGRRGPSYPH